MEKGFRFVAGQTTFDQQVPIFPEHWHHDGHKKTEVPSSFIWLVVEPPI
jgi:hypothetical protein